jgi:DNA replication protein DnaC
MIDDKTARPCECQERLKIERLFRSSRITPAFRTKTFRNFSLQGRPEVVRQMYDCARDYNQRFSVISKTDANWLVFLGQPGSGKTHLTMAVANELIKNDIPVLYFQNVEGYKELIGMIQSGENIREKIEAMKKVRVLVWDDLWKPVMQIAGNRPIKKAPTPFEVETAFEVLNYRYLNLLPTMISSERDDEELLGIDEATGSRIIERGAGHMVLIENKQANYRLV